MGLVLERKQGQSVHILFDENMTAAQLDELCRKGITITLAKINDSHSRARIDFQAPAAVTVLREELLDR